MQKQVFSVHQAKPLKPAPCTKFRLSGDILEHKTLPLQKKLYKMESELFKFGGMTWLFFGALCPSFAYIFCIFYSFAFDYKDMQLQECNFTRVLPTVSRMTYDFLPQRLVWQFLLTATSIFQIGFHLSYYQFYKQKFYMIHNEENRLKRCAGFLVCMAGILKIIGVLIAIHSEDSFPAHEVGITIFSVAGITEMVTHIVLHQLLLCHFQGDSNLRKALWCQISMFLLFLTGFIGYYAIGYQIQVRMCWFPAHLISCGGEYLCIAGMIGFYFSAWWDICRDYQVSFK